MRGATHYIVGLGSNATHVRDPDGLSKALADGVRDGLVDGDVGLDLLEKAPEISLGKAPA